MYTSSFMPQWGGAVLLANLTASGSTSLADSNSIPKTSTSLIGSTTKSLRTSGSVALPFHLLFCLAKASVESGASIKGFVGGTVSGLTKLLVGHPFDTIKVRMQCSPFGTYTGPLDCFLQLARRESLLGLYRVLHRRR